MRTAAKLVALLGLLRSESVFSFLISPRKSFISTERITDTTLVRNMSAMSEVPTLEEVSHAEKVIQLLGDATNKHNNLQSMLEAQLSHSDGIRGFFVTYLTGTGDTSPADNPTVPDVLQKAMTQVDEKELVPLACMNVVMPTGMITMHEDPNLSEQSKKTAERGSRILASLNNNQLVQDNCRAILAVAHTMDDKDAASAEAKPDLVQYWTDFFEKWGYKDAQRKDIADAITNVING